MKTIQLKSLIEFFLKYFQGDLVKQFKDNNVNKDDADFKQAINELKLRKKALEDQVKMKDILS